MVRKHNKKALYEVITQESLGEQYKKQQRLQDITENGSVPAKKIGKWARKPRILQLNGDRVEMSMPFQLAIALILGIILLLLVAFRLGQISRTSAEPQPVGPSDMAKITDAGEKPKVFVSREKKPSAKETGDNRIVIATHENGLQLNPVRSYFDNKGIKTEIRKIGNIYYLVTQDKYNNPNKRGTDGYEALAKIKKIGADYKQPKGYASFGIKPFQDAYGKKFGD